MHISIILITAWAVITMPASTVKVIIDSNGLKRIRRPIKRSKIPKMNRETLALVGLVTLAASRSVFILETITQTPTAMVKIIENRPGLAKKTPPKIIDKSPKISPPVEGMYLLELRSSAIITTPCKMR